MPFRARHFMAATLVAAFVAAACGGRRDSGLPVSDATLSHRDSTRILGLGDVQIASTDSSVEIAVIGDTIVTGLGRRVRDEVRRATDTAEVQGSGFAAGIEKLVKSKVADAMGTQLLFPVKDVEEITFTDGKLQLIGKGGGKIKLFQNTRKNGESTSDLFRAEDADRLIAAFHARRAALR
jgi:hypothetical protein